VRLPIAIYSYFLRTVDEDLMHLSPCSFYYDALERGDRNPQDPHIFPQGIQNNCRRINFFRVVTERRSLVFEKSI
jgi:hypothetical protein